MHILTITGASDDLIELGGDLEEEFSHYSQGNDDKPMLAISDGTLLSVRYDDDGIWRFDQIYLGEGTVYGKVLGSVKRDTNDKVTLTSSKPFTWVLFGEYLARE